MAYLETNLREYRIKKGLKQEELGKIVNVRRETIMRLEKGMYNPSLKLAWDLAKFFNVSIEALFWFED